MGKRLIGSVGISSSGVPDDLLTTKGDTHGFSSTNARIPIGDDDDVLTADSGEALGLKWSPPSTSGTLVKVSKTFSDISSDEMPVYTLPASQALVNVFTDITTVFDVSTAVTIGDASDPNGFQESTDWTSGTGLTSATRGVYVSQFKGMRSTSGTTPIVAYDFTSATTPPSFDAQAFSTAGTAGTVITESAFTVANNSNRILIVCAGVEAGAQTISGITWNGVENFTLAVTLGESSRRTAIWYLVNPTATTADVVTTWSSSANKRGAGVYSFYNVNQASPIGVTNTAIGTGTTTTGTITPTTAGSLVVDVTVTESSVTATDSLTAGWVTTLGGTKAFGSQYDLTPTINASNNMFYTYSGSSNWNWCGIEVKTASTPVGDTQGAVDFYLQIAKE